MKKLAIFGSAIAFSLLSNVVTHSKAMSQPAPEENSADTEQVTERGANVTPQYSRISGVWNANDDGVYYIRQVGNQIWWFGQSSDNGRSWSNVFYGTKNGNKITGRWADVPKGGAKAYGSMTLSFSGSRIQKISGGENFSGSLWSR